MHHRHRLRALALGLVAIAALAPAGALAHPARDLATPAIKPGSIPFTNPLSRSRGPGAGAGLL